MSGFRTNKLSGFATRIPPCSDIPPEGAERPQGDAGAGRRWGPPQAASDKALVGGSAIQRRVRAHVVVEALVIVEPGGDFREEDNGYVLSADLPGVRRDDVDITMDRNRLTIRGKRETAAVDENGELLQSERAVGTFYRQSTLPETVAKDGISAKYENGVLKVVLPKEAASQPRRIAVAG